MRTVLVIAIVATLATHAFAMEFWNVEQEAIACTTPTPIAEGNVYPLAKTGCVMIPLVWGLVEPPQEVQPGVMRANSAETSLISRVFSMTSWSKLSFSAEMT